MKTRFLVFTFITLMSAQNTHAATKNPAPKTNKTSNTSPKKTVTAEPVVTKEVTHSPENQNQPALASEARNKNENWYFQFNLGGARQRYGSGLESSAKTLRDSSLTKHSTIYFDLNFLWPMNEDHSSALGVTLGGVVDIFKQDSTSKELSASYTILGATYQHYLNSNFGDGFFLRGDAGFSKPSVESKVSGVTTKGEAKTGIGLRAGAGYSFLLSNETRLPVSITYQRVFSKDQDGSNVGGKALIFAVGMTF